MRVTKENVRGAFKTYKRMLEARGIVRPDTLWLYEGSERNGIAWAIYVEKKNGNELVANLSTNTREAWARITTGIRTLEFVSGK